MPAAALPANETDRLTALRSYDVLDSVYESVYDELAQAAAKLTHCPMGAVSLIDADRQWFKAREGIDVPETPRSVAFCAHAILCTEPVIVEDARLDPRFSDNPSVTDEVGIRFYAGVPLINAEGYALGTLCVADREPRTLTPEEQASLAGLARAAMMTLELRRKMRQMQGLAMSDALTGLPNRAAFMMAVEQAISRLQRHNERFTLAYLDLDGFKAINDGFGHAEGDRVLQSTTLVMKQHVRREDDLGRIGGDEFALLAAADAAGVATATRLCGELSAYLSVRGWPVTCSIGAVCFLEAPANAESALTAADRAMYVAKKAGKSRVIVENWPPVA